MVMKEIVIVCSKHFTGQITTNFSLKNCYQVSVTILCHLVHTLSHIARTYYVPGAYRCSDYKRRLLYGLVTLGRTISSTGMLIKTLTHAQITLKWRNALFFLRWLWTKPHRKG